jgi:hypothetical protein
MSRQYTFFIFSILMLVNTSCEDDHVVTRGYPVTDTTEITDINEHGVTFHGNILDVGNGASDHGFVYGYSMYLPFPQLTRISLGPKDTPGNFSSTATQGLVKGNEYYVRAYAISPTNGTIVFGQPLAFVSMSTSR